MSRDRAALVALWLLVVSFNATKAIHIDDPIFLSIAQQIVADPLHPMSGTLVESGFERRIADTHEPHLVPALYAGVIAIFGESPLALHALHALFTAAALSVFYALARRLDPDAALLLTAMFALGAGFLPAQNLMVDVPLVTLWIATLGILATRLDGPDGFRWFVTSAALLSAACMVKYTSLAILPLLLLPMLWRRTWHWWPALLLPPATLALWSGFNLLDYGEAHMLTRPRPAFVIEDVARRAVDWLRALGAISPFSLLFIPWARRHPRTAGVFAALALAAAAWPPAPVGDGPFDAALARIFLANGVLLLLLTGAGLWALARERPERALLLAGWIAGPGAFIVLFTPFMAVRHVALVIPAVLLALRHEVTPASARGWWRGAAAATAALGVVLAVSDWGYADVYRGQVRALAERTGGTGQVYYLGDWGFGWYARRAGMRPYLLGKSELAPGDRLVLATGTVDALVQLAAAEGMRRVDQVDVPASSTTTLRTMLPWKDGGGYYAFRAPGLPWTTSEKPLERFVIYAPK